MSRKDVTRLVERAVATEERAGVRLDGLFATFDEDDSNLMVNGEMSTPDGGPIDRDVCLLVTAYDDRGRVLDTSSTYVGAEEFVAPEPFSVVLYDLTCRPSRIRVHLKLGAT